MIPFQYNVIGAVTVIGGGLEDEEATGRVVGRGLARKACRGHTIGNHKYNIY